MTGHDQNQRRDNEQEQQQEQDPTDLPLLPDDTVARRIVDRAKTPWVIAVLIVVFAPMVGWVGFTVYSDLTSPDYATATIYDESGRYLESVEGRVAATWREQYVGLSETDSLEAGHGLFFLHDTEKEHTYVMREMTFPIDIIFIDKKGRITTIHHAEVEEPPLTKYQGRAKYVLEVPYKWTTENDIGVGARVDIEWGYPRTDGGGSTVVAGFEIPPADSVTTANAAVEDVTDGDTEDGNAEQDGGENDRAAAPAERPTRPEPVPSDALVS